ncbi:MAG: type II secretion system F family protein [Planctomycetes bacterium]|nr:type II secretion system F family protein [Planctomycetota bacterium]
MATYQYTAKTTGGEEVAGLIQADSEAAVIRALDEKRLFPVRVAEKTDGARSGQAGRRVRPRDVGVMYAQLSDLLGADVPALRALDILARSTVNKRLAALMGKVRDDVAGGKTLADAMGAYPEVFTPLHAAMIRAGERAGFLEDVLLNMAAFIERQDELHSKVIGAMVYPVIVVTVALTVVLGVLLFMVPKFKALFETMKSIPWPTAVLFAASDAVLALWPLLLMILVVTVIGVGGFLTSEQGRRVWDRWRLRLPLVGKAARLIAITRFCRILGTMLKNGVPVLQALAIAKDATGSTVLAESIEEAAENVRAGQTLAEPLKSSGLFPIEILEMIAVAEESNQLEKTLLGIADTVERRTNRQVDLAVRLIEPLILVLMGAGIGFFGVALVYPIFSMAGAMK